MRYDLIRPTSVIKRWEGGERIITTWAKYAGTVDFQATDFEAYKRVMPHSEYPSGSSCLFQGSEEFVDGYLSTIGLNPATFPVAIGPFPVGSSSVEPGMTPAAELTLQYGNMADLNQVGSESRLDGGMHFDAAVPGGQIACSGVAGYVLDGIFALI